MTPEEVLESEATEACLTPTQKQLVIAAMKEYANSKWNECFDATIYKAQQRFAGMTETQLRLSCIPKPEFKP